MSTIDNLIKIRLDKLEALKKLGVDPYPSHVKRENMIKDSRAMDGREVSIVGRIIAVRGHGSIIFWDIRDESGQIQTVLKKDVCNKEAFQIIEYIDIGDFVSVQGKVGKTQAGEVSVFANNFQIVTKTVRPLPDKWYGLKDIEERYRKRYLDFILNPEVKKVQEKRIAIITAIREFLDSRGYVEVETPTLQPVYGGGLARPFVTHHNKLDSDFYLRISDEMYLKRFIVGGFEKVYEITKVFRNEGIDRDHNPEFTMFEAQIAFKDYTYGMDIIEEIMEHCVKKVVGTTLVTYERQTLNFSRPWKRYKLVDAVREYTGADPMAWKTLDEARSCVQAMEIGKDKISQTKNMRTLGELIGFAFDEAVQPKLTQPTIVYDYPIEVSPLAKKCSDPRFTQRFEQFAYGIELGNNYTELNDPLDLRKRFIEEKKREKAGFEEAHQTDYEYLEAIEHGFPPACGIAIGIDRFVSLITNSGSLKEVIAFPTLRPIKLQEKLSSASKDEESEKGVAKKTHGKKGQFGIKIELGIDYAAAEELVKKYLKDPINLMHSKETEAIMRALAKRLGHDEDAWGIIGLLHDIDWELTKDNTKKHCIKTAEILKNAGGTDFLIETIQSHGYGQGWGDTYYGPPEFEGKERSGIIEHVLAAAETLTGLIIATALIQPDKKLASVKLESLKKKFKNKKFAANCNRDIILECEKIGIQIDEFLDLSLKAIQGISDELGL